LTLDFKHGLWNRLDTEILPFVSRPGRYAGNELNSIHKAHNDGILKIALCFPEMYEIGMSYLGMQILYYLINRRPDCLAERAFAFWPDMEEVMRKKGIPAFSLESSTPLNEFDVIGFHLTYEMTFTTALNVLDLAGIPLLSKDRSENDPLILAGGSSTLNPEPMADFIDAFFLGDAEEAIHGIVDVIRESRAGRLSRMETLLHLGHIPGVYVPQFYQPIYDESGRFLSLKKLEPEAPDKIKIQSVLELRSDYYPRCPIVPFIETTHDHLSIEIMRGCVRGCRFCQAGYQYRPRRQRPVDDIVDHLFNSLACTGYDDVTLLSLSSTDYKDINELLTRINPPLSELRVGLGLPSLRPETLTPFILEAISSGRKTGLTLAPEAGTERLRAVLGKNISDSAIYGAIETALDRGWQTFKLYFMIGLPTETVDDIDGIVAMLRKISHLARQRPGRSSINISLSPFNPKSHTPWQWEKQVGCTDLKRKIDRIIDGVRKPNINIKYRNLDLSAIEGIIGRGDRRLAPVLLKAFQKGSHLDGWSELFDNNRWHEAFAECGVDPDLYSGGIDLDSSLPWDHIDKGISKEFLKDDNLRSKKGIPPVTAFDRTEAIGSTTSTDSGFGRKQKRFMKQTAAPGTYKLRVRYSRDTRLRYLSHLDIIRTLYRAIRRGEIPVAYSEGFHPHIKISFGQPLPVGYTSEAEYFDLQISQPFREEFMIRLKAALPPGLEITGYKYYFANVSSLTKQLNMARYAIPRIEGIEYDPANISKIISSKSLFITRIREGIEKQIDAGQFIENIDPREGGLVLDVRQTPDGHIKPEELLIFGLGFDESLVKPLVIHRKNQFQKTGQRLIEPLDLV
jgi:radical SAM family uncharacterized protein/radical SAM-linked protein